MRIEILENTRYSHHDVLELIHFAFNQWKELGIGTSLLTLTIEQFKERTADSVIFVALDENGELQGTTTCSILKKRNGSYFAFNKYTAVSNQYKNKGVGSLLLNFEKEYARSYDCEYILSDTSVLAPWSIRWHKKNGFRIIGYCSYKNNNYYSYIFRNQLLSPSVWNNFLYVKIVFLLSFFKTKLIKRANGELTKLGDFILKLHGFLIKA